MRRLTRLARMRGSEMRFRVHGLARNAADRCRLTVSGTGWDRTKLARRLVTSPELSAVTTALRGGRWQDAHERLAEHFVAGTARFLIHPSEAPSIAEAVGATRRDAAAASRQLADPILRGHYRLLGYDALDFGEPPDWHFDPVHRRSSPRRFWSDVPYLDPRVGDHKVMWELNRHQHWVVLGRAWWLTGDARYRDRVVRELTHWLSENPPLVGINWASMLELAFRCLSWTWALHMCCRPRSTVDRQPWLVDLLLGLDRQLAHIEQNLSYYFSPNTHLLGEGLALYVCGQVFPELVASPQRIALGRAILLDGADLQIEPDGGHRERSTHYHRYTLDFYLLALAIARITNDAAAVPRLALAVERLAVAARLLADQRGRLPHLGDDDGGLLFPICGRPPDDIGDSLLVAAAMTGRPDLAVDGEAEEALWMLGHPALQAGLVLTRAATRPQPSRSGALPATGYFVSRSPGGDHAVIDAGPHGYLNGGHAHADALSLTLSVGGQPFLVDPGTATYTTDPAVRDRFRSSAAHNTLTVDHRSSSRPAGPFHWSETADARAVRWQVDPHFDYFEGAHEGYAPLTHRRLVLALHDDLFIVADCLDGRGRHRADVHWHVHPDWLLTIGDGLVVATAAHRVVQIASSATAPPQLFCADAAGLGWYSPVYGRIEPLTTVRLTSEATAPAWLCTAFGLDETNPVTSMSPLAARDHAAAGDGAGFRIHRARTVDDVVFRPWRGPRPPDTDAPPTADGRSERPPAWRHGDYASDARLLFCRRDRTDYVHRIVLVDGQHATVDSGAPVEVDCAQPVRAMHIAFAGFGSSRADVAPSAHHTARASGTAHGVRLRVASRSLGVAPERRTHNRATAEGVH